MPFRERLLNAVFEAARLRGWPASRIRAAIEVEHNLPSGGTAFLCELAVSETVSDCLGRPGPDGSILFVDIAFRHTGAGKLLLCVHAGRGASPAAAWRAHEGGESSGHGGFGGGRRRREDGCGRTAEPALRMIFNEPEPSGP
jgi:hypothetical protein